MYLVSNREKFAEWLRRERDQRNWSQNELAIRAGIARGIINKTEAGENDPAPKTLQALARALGYSVDELYRAAGYLPPEPELNETIERIVHMVSDLPLNEQEDVLEFIKMRTRIAEERRRAAEKNKRRPATSG